MMKKAYKECMMRETQGPVFVVHVSRPAEVEQTWKDLPIIMMEQEIMETINYHPTVIISGKTGCGKTTQVPQFLMKLALAQSKSVLEVWLSVLHSHIVWLSSPVATDKRVAHELGVRLGQEVGFQVKYDKKNWLELIYQVL
ncbi:unnamed protein product [Brassica oleracea]|uniref:RNA helicase n=1 Tax=Brassica oleracea TaxID=3712 RepID=A0A3P6C9V2_BRAOL|nr:unnamed protein product [Brassica oleracea]